MAELISIILIGFILDLVLGDPVYRFHPIRLIGNCIACLEKIFRIIGWNGKPGGIVLAALTTILVLFVYTAVNTFFSSLHPWVSFLFNLYVTYSCLALGDLLNHVKPVIRSLEKGDIILTRKEVARIVGREVDSLDEPGVGRAAVETMAENFVDGFLSPLFWFLVGGLVSFLFSEPSISIALCFMLLFKVASTLDSMVGYKDSAYVEFGWAGARFDDLMNFIPARVSIFVLFLGAWATGLKPLQGVKVAIRDRLKHDSPNAGHAESFVAGALGIRLGGPTKYPGGLKKKPWLGDGTPIVGPPHIYRTISLIVGTAWLSVFTLLSPFFFIYYMKAF